MNIYYILLYIIMEDKNCNTLKDNKAEGRIAKSKFFPSVLALYDRGIIYVLEQSTVDAPLILEPAIFYCNPAMFNFK